MRTTRTFLALSALLLPAALGAACGGDDTTTTGATTTTDGATTSTGGTGGDTSTTAPPVDGTPGGAEGDLFIEVSVGGGFVMPGFLFRNLPSVVVYGDGTTLTPGAVPAIYPGPAVSPLTQGSLDDDKLHTLLDAAGAAGLLADEPPDTGDMGDVLIADAPTTTITVVVDGEAHTTDVYALNEAQGSPNMPADVAAARAAIAEFVQAVQDVATEAEQAPYDPVRYRLMPTAAIDDAAADPAPNVLEWPLPGVPLAEGQCVAVSGADADTLEATLGNATEITVWTVGEARWNLAMRPVLSHEPDCP